jgi:uncharacterized damage-inducible protein DinB
MSHLNEIDTFRAAWDFEAGNTIRVLESLPSDSYDFRPDPTGRSLGELAWHLSEVDGYMSTGVAERKFNVDAVIPDLQRPREIKLLAPGYRRVHEQAVARLGSLKNDELDQTVPFFDGRPMAIRDVLWGALLHHLIHHRGQLALMCRIAGGVSHGIYGPNREEMHLMRERMTAKA